MRPGYMEDTMLSEEQLFQEGLTPCSLERKTESISDREALNSRLIAFMQGKGVNGWLAMQSQVLIMRWGKLHCPKSAGGYQSLPPKCLGELGYLVNGELSNASQSLQLSWNGAGWNLVSLSEGGNKDCWRDKVIHLGDGRKDQPVTLFNAHYHRYWHKDNAIRPFAARLFEFVEVTL